MTSHPPLTIMILEDNHADVHLLKESLMKAEIDFEAVVFCNGESAFSYIDGTAGCGTVPPPDAAILDLNVPKRDGCEVLVHIREHPTLQHIPVVILSSSPKDVMRNRAAQADCYISKPSDLATFLAIGQEIRDCVETVRATRSMEPRDYSSEFGCRVSTERKTGLRTCTRLPKIDFRHSCVPSESASLAIH